MNKKIIENLSFSLPKRNCLSVIISMLCLRKWWKS